MRVGLPQVVDRPLPQEVAHLADVGVPGDPRGHRRAVVGGHQCLQLAPDGLVLGGAFGLRDLAAQRFLEHPLEGGTSAQDVGVPLAIVGHTVEAVVVPQVHGCDR